MKARMIRDMHRARNIYPRAFENIFMKILYHKELLASEKKRYLQALLNVFFNYDKEETFCTFDTPHLDSLFIWNNTKESTRFWMSLNKILEG